MLTVNHMIPGFHPILGGGPTHVANLVQNLNSYNHKILTDSILDLHGLTQREAHAMLANMLTTAQVRGERCVLVITGKGLRREGGGILKARLPQWLLEPAIRHIILGNETARPQHGGTGAMYVLLRKLR